VFTVTYSAKQPPGDCDRNIHLYNSLNWDDYNLETCTLLAGVPGSTEYCQIGIGTNTLSVSVDMPVIADAILIGDIDDVDEGFQKIRQTGQREDLVCGSRGIIYTTSAAHGAAEQALTAAEVAVAAETASIETGHKPRTYLLQVDLSWPTMICTKCKEKGQHKLYNKGIVNKICTCDTCLANPSPPIMNYVCNCSGCLLEILMPVLKPCPAPTILSTILSAD